MRYAVVNDQTDIIGNIKEWDGGPNWAPPSGCSARLLNGVVARIGWAWNGGTPINTDLTDYSNTNNIDKTLKALALVMADWTGHTPAQLKAAFKARYDGLNGGGGK